MVTPKDITWEVLKAALPEIQEVRKTMTPEGQEEDKQALRKYLCDYFNSEEGKSCDRKQGSAISPVGFRTATGGKCLKVRWLVPGRGKSGGLRLAVVAYCNDRRVKLAGAWLRKDDPTDEDFAAAADKA